MSQQAVCELKVLVFIGSLDTVSIFLVKTPGREVQQSKAGDL
jgi:hypothetical protein